MKIGIEVQRLFRHARHGMEIVASELLSELAKLPTAHQFTVFTRKPPQQPIPLPQKWNMKSFEAISYGDWEQIFLPRHFRSEGCQLLHCTANTGPLRLRRRMLLTLHDTIFMEETGRGGSAYQRFGNLYRKAVVPRIVNDVRCIITVSQYEKTRIREVFGVDEQRVVVIPNAVSERFRASYSDSQIESVRARYRMPQRFILFHGNTAPKKNMRTFVRAYSMYCNMAHSPLPLVITDIGPKDNALFSDLTGTVMRNISFPGYIPHTDMPLVYKLAKLFVYPSLRESFGLPLLEAMASGVPVIASRASAIPETAGGAAFMIDPNSPKEIAEAMEFMLISESRQLEFREAGINRAAEFSWLASAKQLLDVYDALSNA
jgi:glycosyltransferase involved in cell wall biosynthesis